MSAPIELRCASKRARIHDPRRELALAEIESEVRYDPLTGDSARICHFAYPKREPPDLAALAEATRPGCPFCPDAAERVTPRYPEDLIPGGRLRLGEALLAPNLFPYDDVSAIVVLSRAHWLPMAGFPAGRIADALKLAREFVGRAAALLSGREAYGIVTWNYMPPAGASQVHPHMQVIVTDTPGNALRRELAAEAAFLARHGSAYAPALLAHERGGPRWLGEEAGVSWLVPWCPIGVLGGAQALLPGCPSLSSCDDARIEAFARSLSRLLAAYSALGMWSFNLTLLPDAEGERTGRHDLAARLLPRFYLQPNLHTSDTAYLQLLLGEQFAMVTPERHAAELREALAHTPSSG